METCTTWQLNFSKIQDLKIDISVRDFVRNARLRVGEKKEALSRLKGWLSESELVFKAKKAQAQLSVHPFPSPERYGGHSDTLEGMAKRAERVD
jgi:hypothetical protein